MATRTAGMRVTVVGAGPAGAAAAARLAKLGHRVTVHEAGGEVGGSLLPTRVGDARGSWAWDARAATTTLPAALRDLFRKSGRPLESALELVPCSPGRRHVFAGGPAGDGPLVLDLELGSRGAQRRAMTDAFGAREALAWERHLDDLGAVWEVLRRTALEQPYAGPGALDRRQRATLRPRRSLHRSAARLSRDPRVRALVLDRHRLAGQDPRSTPAFVGVVDQVERAFGRWRPVGGGDALAAALTQRLEQRRVEVRLDSTVRDVVLVEGRATGVRLDDDRIEPADVVVWTAPLPPPTLVGGDQPCAPPATWTYVGLTEAAPILPPEVLCHGDRPVAVRTTGVAPAGHRAWSLEHLPGDEDVLETLARYGLDVREHVVVRTTRSATDQLRARGASPQGLAWQGWRTGARRSRPQDGPPGFYRLGADVHPGPGLVLALLGAAQVAAMVGPP